MLRPSGLDAAPRKVTDVGISTLAASVPDGTELQWQLDLAKDLGFTQGPKDYTLCRV